jgi:hypothetical protein
MERSLGFLACMEGGFVSKRDGNRNWRAKEKEEEA